MHLTAVVAFAVLVLLGCFSFPTGNQTEAPPPAPVVPPPAHVLAWSLRPGTPAVTAWIDAERGVLATRKGIVMAGPDALWVWDVEPSPTATLDCACYDPFNLPDHELGRQARRTRCTRATPVDGLVLAEQDGTRILPVLPGETTFEGELSRVYEPLGQVGPFVFAARTESRYPCGAAHPDEAFAHAVIDLRIPGPASLFSPSELHRLETNERVAAARALCVEPACSTPDPEGARLTSTRPAWGGDVVTLEVQYTVDAAYAESDGRWDSSTRSASVEAVELPASLGPFGATPPAVLEWWKTMRPTAAGWGAVDPKLRATFGGDPQ